MYVPSIGKTILNLVFGLFLLVFSVSTAVAIDHGSDSTNHGKHGISNLNPTQKIKIKELSTQLKKELIPLKNLLDEKRARLKTLESAEKTDLASIHSIIDEIHGLQSKMMKLKANHKQEIRKILTPEQRTEFDFRSEKKGKRGEGNHRHKGRGRHGRN